MSLGVPVLIRNGTVVNEDEMTKADVLCRDGKIVAVGPNLDAPTDDTKIVDATDKLVVPGGIDPHTHCQLPFMGTVAVDDFNHGTRAAVAGGTTCIVDFAIPQKGESLLETYDKWRGWADPKVVCDYGLHVAVTWWDEEGKVAAEMETLVKEKGIQSFKCFMAYKNVFMVTDAQMFEIFKVCRRVGALAQVHAENGDAIEDGQKRLLEKGVTGPEGHCLSRPADVEGEATYRALMIGDKVNTPVYIVHVMSREACDAVTRARKEGKICFGEPIAAGLQDRMSVVWSRGVHAGILTPMQFVAVTSTNAARIFGMYPRKGVIRVGADADICVWDPNAKRTISAKTHFHAVDFNIFEGQEVTGVAHTTISRGDVVFENGALHVECGHGKFVPRDPFGYNFVKVGAKDKQRELEEQAVDRKPYTGPVWTPAK